MSKNPKIFLIEDDEMTIELYKDIFNLEKIDLEIFEFGGLAIKKIKEIKEGKSEKPDLILLDLLLPDMNGLEILKQIRKYPETKDIKICVLTNYTNPKLDEELKKEKVNAILRKTEYTPKQLIEKIKQILEEKID